MNQLIISIIAVLLYLTAVGLLSRHLSHTAASAETTGGTGKTWLIVTGLCASALHGFVLYSGLFTPMGLDIGFFSIFSMVGWLIALLLLLAAISQPVESLGIIVFPFAALALILRITTTQHHILTQQLTTGVEFHILSSILAYSMLSIAAVQALLLYFQETQLRNKHPGGSIRALPPLETMETLLFRMIGLGFIMLYLSLMSGVFYLENIFAQHLVHKTVLSIFAWILFAVLLWGRWQFGWRGRTAIRWTLSGFTMLMLAYFGSKFVIELILQR